MEIQMRYLIGKGRADAVDECAAPLRLDKVGLLFGFSNPNVVHVKLSLGNTTTTYSSIIRSTLVFGNKIENI